MDSLSLSLTINKNGIDLSISVLNATKHGTP